MAEIFNTNLPNVASAYIRQLKVRVTISSLRQQLIGNPYFPSLYSLSSTLERFQIPNLAVKIDKENFNSLTPLFITYACCVCSASCIPLTASRYLAERQNEVMVQRGGHFFYTYDFYKGAQGANKV